MQDAAEPQAVRVEGHRLFGHRACQGTIGAAMRIDVHAHTIPPGFADWLTRTQGPNAMANMLTPHGWVSLEERAELLAEAGIDLQVLSLGARVRLPAEAARVAN